MQSAYFMFHKRGVYFLKSEADDLFKSHTIIREMWGILDYAFLDFNQLKQILFYGILTT